MLDRASTDLLASYRSRPELFYAKEMIGQRMLCLLSGISPHRISTLPTNASSRASGDCAEAMLRAEVVFE